jgi:hypothetical protein
MRKFFTKANPLLVLLAFSSIVSVVKYASFSSNNILLNNTYHNLLATDFYQDWSDIGLITSDNNWDNVPSIIGYSGAIGTTTATGRDPQTILEPFSDTQVDANHTSLATATGGVFEFHITNPTIAIQPSGGSDAPNIVLHLNTTGVENAKISYNLRDIDNTDDNAIQPIALQYRIGELGNFINIPSGFVADASAGPFDTLNTFVEVLLPYECGNQPQLQLRIISWNAVGSDEFIGLDNINVSKIEVLDCDLDTVEVVSGIGFIAIDSFLADYVLTPSQTLLVNGIPVTGPLVNVACVNGEFSAEVALIDQTGILIDTLAKCTKLLYASDIGEEQEAAVLNEINISLDENCEAYITPQTVLANVASCVGDIVIGLDYPQGSTVFVPANKLDGSHIGQKIKYTLTLGNGLNAWGYLNVEEKLGPEITIPPDVTTFCSEDSDPDV